MQTVTNDVNCLKLRWKQLLYRKYMQISGYNSAEGLIPGQPLRQIAQINTRIYQNCWTFMKIQDSNRRYQIPEITLINQDMVTLTHSSVIQTYICV